ncbi:ECF transporter S component [[Mycoplasma] collis]|uniref:ECF transporter S component n=1 Tax=[Mycoplasma] collis TaxID=2127 RepID=UPI00051B5D14|nr:ECF transporter S component [[Mycoplasma] collis]
MQLWNNRNIAFVAVFISISTIMLLLGIRLFPIAVLPSLRFSIVGLPIKITGFIFGPIIGFLTGFLTDLVSFWFAPTSFSPYYTIALALNGFIPGIVSWIFLVFLKKNITKKILEKNLIKREENIKLKIEKLENIKFDYSQNKLRIINKKILKLKKKLSKPVEKHVEKNLQNLYLISCVIILTILFFILFLYLNSLNISFFEKINEKIKFIKGKIDFMLFISMGTLSMIAFVIVSRFIKFFQKKERFLTMVPIVVFSAILEPIASSLLSLGDVNSKQFDSFETAIIAHFSISPIKIWINLFIIYLTSLVVIPIVKNKTKNTY